MKKTYQTLFFLFLIVGATLASCSSSGRMGGAKKGCGCGIHKGFVGY